jgi:hypothetical protein
MELIMTDNFQKHTKEFDDSIEQHYLEENVFKLDNFILDLCKPDYELGFLVSSWMHARFIEAFPENSIKDQIEIVQGMARDFMSQSDPNSFFPCGEISYEIARQRYLGFLHEQNRYDRSQTLGFKAFEKAFSYDHPIQYIIASHASTIVKSFGVGTVICGTFETFLKIHLEFFQVLTKTLLPKET